MQLPQPFIENIHRLLGAEEGGKLLDSLLVEQPVSIRINRQKMENLPSDNILKEVPWCPGGCYLDHRPTFTFDPLFHAGAYYVQEASSMFVAHNKQKED